MLKTAWLWFAIIPYIRFRWRQARSGSPSAGGTLWRKRCGCGACCFFWGSVCLSAESFMCITGSSSPRSPRFCCCPRAGGWTRRCSTVSRLGAAFVSTLSLLSLAVCFTASPNTGDLFKPREDTMQYRFAAVINRVPDATMLNYFFMDSGLLHRRRRNAQREVLPLYQRAAEGNAIRTDALYRRRGDGFRRHPRQRAQNDHRPLHAGGHGTRCPKACGTTPCTCASGTICSRPREKCTKIPDNYSTSPRYRVS